MTDSTDSHLTDSNFGYDFVTAVTQDSINVAIIDHVDVKRQPLVSICYVMKNHKPELIEFDELLKLTNNTDPFKIPTFPAGTDIAKDDRIQNLFHAGFKRGFQCRLGSPPMSDLTKTPDFVTLGIDTSQVRFNLLCAECTIVEYTPGGGYDEEKWEFNQQQQDNPWIFQAKVDLRLDPVPESAFSKLPPDVQDRIKNLGDTAFTIDQLLFDFENAALSERPKWVNPDTDLGNMLMAGPFAGTYFDRMRAKGEPLLGCVVKPTSSSAKSSLELTDFAFKVCPFLDSTGRAIKNPTKKEQSLSTLNYLCATGGRNLPNPMHAPNWNWVSEGDSRDEHGVISINRDTFAAYLRPELLKCFLPNCFTPWVLCEADGLINVKYDCGAKREATETELKKEDSGETIFTLKWSKASEQASENLMGSFTLKNDYNATVKFKDNTIIISQDIDVYIHIRLDLTTYEAHPVRTKITDTYTIAINPQGKLQVDHKPDVLDNPDNKHIGGMVDLYPGVHEFLMYLSLLAEGLTLSFGDIPVSVVSDFIFPGGKAFSYSKVGFSKHQDLVSTIRYVSSALCVFI